MSEVLISGTERKAEREAPKPEWIVGDCPCCGSPVVSNAYHVGGHPGGYVLRRECWSSLGDQPTCEYRRVI